MTPFTPLDLRQLLREIAPAADEDARRAAYQRRRVYTHHPEDHGVDPTRYGDWEYNGRCTDFT